MNNEIGSITDISHVVRMVRDANGRRNQKNQIFVHTDAVQVPGHLFIDVEELGIDFLTISAHKFHGPVGVGLLYVREPRSMQALMFGGQQQQGIRPGTESVALVVALSNAFLFANHRKRISEWNQLYNFISYKIWEMMKPFVLSGLVLPTETDVGLNDKRKTKSDFDPQEWINDHPIISVFV